MQYKELISKRKSLLARSNKNTIITKGSHQVHSVRVCALCGAPLSKYIVIKGEPPYFIAVKKHYILHYKSITLAICFSPKMCFKNKHT